MGNTAEFSVLVACGCGTKSLSWNARAGRGWASPSSQTEGRGSQPPAGMLKDSVRSDAGTRGRCGLLDKSLFCDFLIFPRAFVGGGGGGCAFHRSRSATPVDKALGIVGGVIFAAVRTTRLQSSPQRAVGGREASGPGLGKLQEMAFEGLEAPGGRDRGAVPVETSEAASPTQGQGIGGAVTRWGRGGKGTP